MNQPRFLLLFAALAVTADAADWTLLRRVAQGAECTGSLMDAKTTLDLARYGGIEANPLLGRGKPDTARIIGTKAGLCAVQIAFSEWRHHRYRADVSSERRDTFIAVGSTGAFTGLAIRNSALADALKK